MTEPPFSLLNLDHVVLRVKDIERSFLFYIDVLGCSLERELPDMGLYQLRAGNSLIDLVPIGSKLGGSDEISLAHRNLDHFCIQVNDFDEKEIKTYLAANGIDCGEAANRYGAAGYGPSLYITDPDGNVVELKGPGSP